MSNKFSSILKIILAIIIAILMILACILPAFAVDTKYQVEDIGLTISVPDNMRVITRDTQKDAEVFTLFDYQQTMDNFEKADIYLEGVDTTKNNLLLVVTMTTNDRSKDIDNYNSLTDEELAQVQLGYMDDANYTSCKKVNINDYTYLELMMETQSDGKLVQSQQYHTVVNGKNYVIILQAEGGKKLKNSHKELLTQIVNSVTIEKIPFFRLYGTTIVIASVSTVLGIGLLVLLIIFIKRYTDPQRKHNDLVHQLAHEHRISETTRIPRKKLHKYMLENAPEEPDFMEEYDPIEEAENNGVKKGVSGSTVKFQQIATPKSESKTVEEAEVIEHTREFNGGTSYFTDVPDEKEMYVYSDVATAVEDYKLAKKVEQRRKAREAQQAKARKDKSEIPLKILKAIGTGILAFLQGVVAVICYLAVHIKYFSINLFRLIKRKRAEKKRRKIIAERRQKEEERLKMRREAEMRRRQRNSQRGENDLIQVRSRSEGRTYPRSGYERNYNRRR